MDLNKEKTKTKIGNNSFNKIANTIDSKNAENIKSKQNLKRNKSKNLMDSNINNKTNKTSKKDKHIKTMTGNLNNLNYNKKISKDFSSKNLSKKKEEKNENEQNEENTKNKNLNENKSEINPEMKQENIIDNNMTLIENNKENNQIMEANKLQNDNNENIKIVANNEPLFNQDNDELDNYVLDNFTKKLEDFQLLYNDEYIKSIKEEDFSLEIELYIEKFIELINEYHIQTEEKDLEYHLLKNMYQKNIFLYLEINKLYKKLQLIKDYYDLKKNNPKPINEGHDKNYANNLITNKIEINMFNRNKFKSKSDNNGIFYRILIINQ